MFNTKVLQATIAHKFGVEIKKLHLSMSGHKYDLGKKPSCKMALSGDQDKTGKTADKPPKQNAAKKDNTKQPSQSDMHEIQDPEKTPPDTSKLDTDNELPYGDYDDDDSLPDPFPTSQQQEFEKKTQQSSHGRHTTIKVLKYLIHNMCKAISTNHVLTSTSILLFEIV